MGLIDGLLGHAGETPVDKLAEEFAALLAPGEALQRAFSTIRDLVPDGLVVWADPGLLERIVDTTRIFEAWSDEAWVNEGAAVRVSLIGFGPFS